jgi:O-antigen ligase
MGLDYFLTRPLQGFGFGTEDKLFAYHDVNPQNYQQSGAYMHNSYLGLVLQVGIVGALLFYVPLAYLLFHEVFTKRKIRNDPLFTALLSVVLTCMVAGMFSSELYSMGNAKSFVFWISVMLLVRALNKHQTKSF